MTTFDDKEKAAENKYAHDQELAFKIHARAHKLLGQWAAGKMGLAGLDADAYAASIVTIDLAKADPQHLFEKIRTDLLSKAIAVSDHEIRAEMHKSQHLAQEQFKGNG